MAIQNISDAQDTLTILKQDDYLSQFVPVNNENKLNTNSIRLSIEQKLSSLNKGLQHVEKIIRDQTYKNYKELFNQVTWIENLESIIYGISLQIQNLQSLIELLKSRVVDLFVKVQTQVILLNKLNATCGLLRKIMRTQILAIQSSEKGYNLSSNSMFEIKELIIDKDLKEISFLNKDLTKLCNICKKNQNIC
ncbi:Conserved oligomeric Golgi complex subunit 5 [Cinara cedri]|uniref:Conserved oligomeric Golgi complex subunit 5 n=1 Tax=Cinara cedri TaxID=506608 RepID=A0A5E4MI07_9HEMI|nr:Conserved oligomeric Golgi complex subunit 5 [Cinara cedri]